MKIDCCMISTNLQTRLQLMLNCVDSLKKHEEMFDQKIMSVDIFPEGLPLDFYSRFEKEGWNVISKKVAPKGSMVLNQRNVIASSSTEIFLYTEDDVLINNLPKLTTIEKLFNENVINGRKAGFICFGNHIYKKFNQNPKHIIDFIHNLDNYLIIDGDVFLIKNEVIQDEYYLNFPTSMTTKSIYNDLADYSYDRKEGWHMETALTSAWFETGKEKEYAVLISLKPEIISDIKSGKKITVSEFYNYANINFWNNDATLHHAESPNRKGGWSIKF